MKVTLIKFILTNNNRSSNHANLLNLRHNSDMTLSVIFGLALWW